LNAFKESGHAYRFVEIESTFVHFTSISIQANRSTFMNIQNFTAGIFALISQYLTELENDPLSLYW